MKKGAFIASLAIVLGIILPFASVLALTNSSSITVGLSIPVSSTSTDNGGGGGGNNNPPPTDNPPTISSVINDVATSTAIVSWSASDDNGIQSVGFVYGTTPSYGINSTVTGNYQVIFSNLSPSTTYYYQISVTDTGSHTITQTGSFTTQAVADITPPTISSVVITTNVTTATIKWNVNERATGQISYGLTASYGTDLASSAGVALVHSVDLPNLLSSTTYHYKVVATDGAGNSSSTSDGTFTTLADTTPPANPSNVVLTTSTNAIALSWTNPTDADFSGVTIIRKTGSAPASRTDGTSVYTGTDQIFNDTTVVTGVTYYYALYSFDTSKNYSSGVTASGKITIPVTNEICGNTVDDDHNGLTDCADAACSTYAACRPKIEICNNNIDDDSNGLTDCADPACSGANYCALKTEICDNGIDDDTNGKTDCDDATCFSFPACQGVPVSNNYQPPTSTVSNFDHLTIADVTFWAVNRTVSLTPNGSTVSSLAGSTLTVVVDKAKLLGSPNSIALVIDGNDRNEMKYNAVDQSYSTDITIPRVGLHTAGIEINYGDTVTDNLVFTLQGLAAGMVTAGGQPLAGATLTLFDKNNNAVNGYAPIQSDENGIFGWVVPNGTYSVRASKKGYYDRQSYAVAITNNVFNDSVDLVAEPPDLLDAISATSSLAENATIIAKNIGAKTKALAQLGAQQLQDTAAAVQEFKSDPVVQQQASQVVAPTAVTVTAVGTVAIVSWGNFLPFLRLLFLQPLLLLGLRRRKGWGQVYNTLNKMPVDLATIRLVSAETGKVIQSKVTDKEGRYAFVVNPGKYHLQVTKNGFAFPSLLLAHATSDGRRTDIYHGEVIEVSAKDAVITANIPLDPIGEHKRPPRIFWQHVGRASQIAASWFGLLVTAASLYISPKWYVWLLLGVHVLFFIIFRRLAIPAKIKSWGIAYDGSNKKPIGRVIARLFNSEFNKLVATQVTDGAGRYYFLASDDKYYVTYDHPDYIPEKTNVLDLTGKNADNIAIDVALKKSSAMTLPVAPAVMPTPKPDTVTRTRTAPIVTPAPQNPPVVPHIDLNNPPEPPANS